MITKISGGVTAAQGFSANGVHCGIRKNHSKKDLALIVSEVPAAAAAVYTQNLVKGAPLAVTKAHLADGYASAIICNSGNANTCNANGVEIAEAMCQHTAAALGCTADQIAVASTGVIGQPLDIAPMQAAIPGLVAGLGQHSNLAAEAIMTTDTVAKDAAVSFTIQGKTCVLGGIAKGTGMIHPNMATMLIFLTTDLAIEPALLQKALSADVKTSFNMVSVDGDTSTNDMCIILANGLAGNTPLSEEDADYQTFVKALNSVTVNLCKQLAADGEGATKLLEVTVSAAPSDADAVKVAKAVACSSLLKAAMFGADANWGRVLCAIGYSEANIDIHKVDVSFCSQAGTIQVCKDGAGVPFSEQLAKKILSENQIKILISLAGGEACATAWGCDLTYDYVKINGEYRS